MKRLAKSVAKQTTGLAKSVAKQAAQDIGEIPRETSKQVIGGGSVPGKQSVIVEAMQKSDGQTPEISKEEELKIKASGLKQIEKLEAEMAKHREEREKDSNERKGQVPVPEAVLSEPGKPILPTSKPTRGAAARSPAAKKKRKIESPLGKS